MTAAEGERGRLPTGRARPVIAVGGEAVATTGETPDDKNAHVVRPDHVRPMPCGDTSAIHSRVPGVA